MTPFPVGYRIPGAIGVIIPSSPLWQLALSEKAFDFPRRNHKPAGNDRSVTIGDYFLAAEKFLLQGQGNLLFSAFRSQTGAPLGSQPHPVTVSLSLEKHGAFYHPLKVVIKKQGHPPCSLVLNGAVSLPGLAMIEKEYSLLSKIRNRVDLDVFPRVYGMGRVDSANGPIGFFLGEWFEGFCEFHATIRGGKTGIAVWGDNGKVRRLSVGAAAPVYQNIAYVLTSAYDLDTGEQIYPWHHAAGDFIVQGLIDDSSDDKLPVKLITVRGYNRFAGLEGGTAGASLLTGLFIFFLNMSLRMQMDRIDGVGEPVFLGDAVLAATLEGFFRGLDHKAARRDEKLKQVFVEFAVSFTPEQWGEILENVLEAQTADVRETLLIKKNLKDHCRKLHTLLKTHYLQDFY